MTNAAVLRSAFLRMCSPRRPEPRHFQALAFALLLLLLATFANAQDSALFDSTPGKFSCGDYAAAGFPGAEGDGLRTTAFTKLDGKPATLPRGLKVKRFGPFDAKRYGFSAVEFYQFLTGDAGEHMDTTTDAHLYVRLVGSQGDSWFAFPGKDAIVDKADPPSVAAQQDNAEPDSTAPKPPSDDSPLDISTPDPALPLFQVSFTSRWLGANAGGGYGNVLIVDLRSGSPNLAKHMQCVWGEGGGVCTAPDSQYGGKSQLSCVWKKEASDYDCDEKDTSETGWGSRFTESRYLLLAGTDTFQLPTGAADSLEHFVFTLTRQKVDGKKVLLPDAGETTGIYSVLQQDHDLHLFAARGTSDSLDARFFLVEQPFSDRPTHSVEIKPASATQVIPIGYADADFQRQKAAAPPQPKVSSRAGGEPLSYHVTKVYGDDDFFVIEVTVKEGNDHSLYWIGVDQRSSPIVADLYRVATDAAPYAQCMTFTLEQSAASYRLLPGQSFRALLDVEPEHRVSLDDSTNSYTLADNADGTAAQPDKSCTLRVSWDRTKGFVTGENPVCRVTKPRSISISDDGKLSTKPIAIEQQQQ